MSSLKRSVILFESVSATLLAEKTLKTRNIPYKVVPVPKHISSDCGVCIRVDGEGLEQAVQALNGTVKLLDIRQLP